MSVGVEGSFTTDVRLYIDGWNYNPNRCCKEIPRLRQVQYCT